MKHVHADKIMQFAKMVEAGNPIDNLVQCYAIDRWFTINNPQWDEGKEYRVAIALLEDKPVFEGDNLWNIPLNPDWATEHTISGMWPNGFFKDTSMNWLNPKFASWNKPEEKKPRTIGDAIAYAASNLIGTDRESLTFEIDGQNWAINGSCFTKDGLFSVTIIKIDD